jgi:tRNA1(Val) A37 N6-methylase TrmN6
LIHRADALDAVLAALRPHFGSTVVLPIHPRALSPARRILVRAAKGGRKPLRLLPGLVLHAPGTATYTPEADGALRGGPLPPPWPG